MKNKFLIFSIFGLALGLGGYYIYAAKNLTQSSYADYQGHGALRAQVAITKDGLIPNEIKLKRGGSVSWTNEDTDAHHIYSETIDSGNLQTGDTYTLGFKDAGKYYYHDSNAPEDKKWQGAVIVE